MNCAAAGDPQRDAEIATTKTNEHLVEIILVDIRAPFCGPNVENSDLQSRNCLTVRKNCPGVREIGRALGSPHRLS
jgi:hypothetical protein